ncbi:DUF805 domain-containing protein [Agrobacterium sp. SORGH_AS 787]|uniref:DUF805 domain-containing protein n=1 Tax=Agrobacterium sp. SORGH_AS 787 TaxID=3041775 RepID=UPI0027858108|nr:uncharacterized membrane protein YhaH (DUF805 family) [Rhizobium sp. SORGH_AS_0787]
MGSFSLWHWVIVLGIFAPIPLFFVFKRPPAGPNRFAGLPYAMSFGEAISSFFKNYVNFSSRASRSEFWYSILFLFLISIVADMIDRSRVLGLIWNLATLVPLIAVNARRLHDLNRSGWLQLFWFLFPIGWLILIIWYCFPAADGPALKRGTDSQLGKDPAETFR